MRKTIFVLVSLFLSLGYSVEESYYDQSLPLASSVHELFALPLPVNRSSIHYRNLVARDAEITPLYPGYGTHFSYIYVGTPAQRQSVIIDTGSHFTAFPCTGCSQCGQHTDNYWDFKASSSAEILQCNNQPCVISQSYSEGSSWRAFKVSDKLWVSGLNVLTVPSSEQYSVKFTFGCQTSETGLFRTQLADGIMGMSFADESLPVVLHKNGVTNSKIFSLCYRVGGGIMTLGGVDQRIHSSPTIHYARLLRNSGWATVKVVDIQLQSQSNGVLTSIGETTDKYNSGKGCIIDSGTTDTYLPSSIATKFTSLFKSMAGIPFTSANIPLSSKDLSMLPNIVFSFESVEDGKTITVSMPWSSYVDSVGGGKYAFRIYLTEGSGMVLGANFMNNFNIIFDPEGLRVGFAKSSCKFEDFVIHTLPPTAAPTANPSISEEPITSPCSSIVTATSRCSASCPLEFTGHQHGNQTFSRVNACSGDPVTHTFQAPCVISCQNGKFVRGYNPECPAKPWSECSKVCSQSRHIPTVHEGTSECVYEEEIRGCFSGSCPIVDGNTLIFMDFRVGISPFMWSSVYSEDFVAALAQLLNVKPGSIELMNDASTEIDVRVKLHFQIRLQQENYKSFEQYAYEAEKMEIGVWDADFSSKLFHQLIKIVDENPYEDHVHFPVNITAGMSRYGWLLSTSVEVINARAMPIGPLRDPVAIPPDDMDSSIFKRVVRDRFDFFMLGVSLALLLLFLAMVYLYYRLKTEHQALEKDKLSNGSLLKTWMKYVNGSNRPSSNSDKKPLDYRYEKLEMQEM